MRSVVLLLACLMVTSCGANPHPRAAAIEEPPRDTTVHWANYALLSERYCEPMAMLSTRTLETCGCSADQREAGFLSEDELAASCIYHLFGQIPEDRAITVDEPALAVCMRALDASLTGCVHARLPPACEPARLFDPAPSVLTYSRSLGSDCRAVNGDGGFDAHFLCASGLTCAGTCIREPIADAVDREATCRNPLGLPPALP